MQYIPETGMPVVPEDQATGEIATLYDEVKRLSQTPFVPNGLTALGVSPPALKVFLAMWGATLEHLTLPETLQSMIGYTIAERNDCKYCAANNELWCRMVGIDEATMSALAADLGNVNPQRIRAIVEFCVKAALTPKAVDLADYENLRFHGVTDEEIPELVLLSAVSVACDIIVDTLKVPVESEVIEALGR